MMLGNIYNKKAGGGCNMEIKNKVPIWNKACLTIAEAAEYSNIGINAIEKLLNNPNCNFVLYVGRKRLVKRKEFECFLDQVEKI